MKNFPNKFAYVKKKQYLCTRILCKYVNKI